MIFWYIKTHNITRPKDLYRCGQNTKISKRVTYLVTHYLKRPKDFYIDAGIQKGLHYLLKKIDLEMLPHLKMSSLLK